MLSFFERLTKPFPDIQNDVEPPKTLLAFYRHYLRGFEWHIAGITFFNVLQAVFEVMLFAFMGQLVDWLSSHDRATFFADESTTLWGMAAVLLVILPLIVIGEALLHYQGIMGNFPMAVRWRMHNLLLKQSMTFYNEEFSGRIATKVMQTALSVRQSVMTFLGVLVYIAVYFLSMVILLGQLHWLMMLPILGWLVIYVGLQIYFIPRLQHISRRQADARSTMTGRVVDAYTNIATVKLFAHTHREADYAQQSMQGFLQTVYEQFRLVTGLQLSVRTLNYLLLFGIAGLGIGMWVESLLTVGAVAVGVSLALRLNSMSQWVMFEVSSLFENIGTTIDGMKMLAKPQLVQDVANAPELHVEEGKIEFKQVGFSYQQKKDSPSKVIDNLSFTIKGGEKIGLVGRSGAGKSTLVNALLRFYNLESGSICIDGQDIAKVSQESLRQQIGMVTQDTALLHRSIRENILYGRPDASDEALRKAIERAEATGFIQNLSDRYGNEGLDAQVGERGVKLSGGQRQRIAIARVLLKDAPILILDEATSALDSEVEAAIQDTLWQLMQGKTVIAIAHRLSTIAAMDRLIVLDEGKIVEQGHHDELIAQNGIYAQLWARQTGGYLGQD
ncbi:ABC transporter ATP-binding protein [Rappaport israeli]|uniref:ABC transporter ATP-binding protein n=1 Tax=Rappaport israeli TaxID=1839807 RepID=UPI000931B5DB|nr:ABC transporter ATP-binding protein [Rappaport israeli]